jgi:hypothetical protein
VHCTGVQYILFLAFGLSIFLRSKLLGAEGSSVQVGITDESIIMSLES